MILGCIDAILGDIDCDSVGTIIVIPGVLWVSEE